MRVEGNFPPQRRRDAETTPRRSKDWNANAIEHAEGAETMRAIEAGAGQSQSLIDRAHCLCFLCVLAFRASSMTRHSNVSRIFPVNLRVSSAPPRLCGGRSPESIATPQL